MEKTIYLASDHAGVKLKKYIMDNLKVENLRLEDFGTENEDSVDYPDYAKLVTDKLANNIEDFGVLICGTGIGMSIAANRCSHIRAALCFNREYARLAREHNNANILVLGAKFLNFEETIKIVEEFLMARFTLGRHEKRLKKLEDLFRKARF